MNFDVGPGRNRQSCFFLVLATALSWPSLGWGQAHSLAGGVGGFHNAANQAAQPGSQTSTAATSATASSAQVAQTVSAVHASLTQSLAAYQRLQASQAAAAQAAAAQATTTTAQSQTNLTQALQAYNLLVAQQNQAHQTALNSSAAQGSVNGIGVGGLNPQLNPNGSLTQTSAGLQEVNLSGGGKNQIVLSQPGTVTLPYGTTGSDQVTLNGSGSVTTTSGSVSATSGSLSTTTGGTLAAAAGGTISLTPGSATLKTTTQATISSTAAGSYTSGGKTVDFSANAATVIPAGATVSFSGSSATTVSVAGAATIQLSGAGTLSLSNPASGTGGEITTATGVTTFNNAVIEAQAAGTSISFSGSGSLAFSGSGNDVLPVIVQANPSTKSVPAFTTTGSVLSTVGYNVAGLDWSGVSALTQATNGSNVTVTVTQDTQQALLNWQTFNIGRNTTLEFDQSAGGVDVGNWVAINRILDPSLSPSTIFGAIEAPGQVYVVNQNGIIFNGSSQVNAHALVASTLPMNENLISGGLLNNPNSEFLFTSQAISVNGSVVYDPNNDPNALPNVTSQGITVDEGASLVSPGSAEGVGGKIALIAPTVVNQGVLSAPDGQVILAAGQQVGFNAHPSSDPSLRGLDVAIGDANGNETVTNDTTGLIKIPEADLTMAAPNIVQNGIIEGETSVSLNARIDILAMSGLSPDTGIAGFNENSPTGGGSIVFGPGSITELLPESSTSDTAVGSSLALPTQVYVEGASFQMDTGAKLIAPNATTTFGIGILNESIASAPGETTSPVIEDGGGSAVQDYLSTPGQLTLEPQAVIDVSGSSDVQASVTENILPVQLTLAVLENSPLQKDGALHGQTVYVDISQEGTNADGSTWYGSPIGDLSGYANLVEHTAGELTVAGGSVAINSNGAVTLDPNSTINVSGGSVNYQGAEVQTSKVVTASGQIINIAQATPNQTYLGVYNGYSTSSAKWGVTQNFTGASQSGYTYAAGFTQGGNGGSLAINSPQAVLNGDLYGTTVTGVRQQAKPPTPSSFVLALIPPAPLTPPPTQDVIIQPSGDSQAADPTALYLSPDLFGADGFGNSSISIYDGKIDVASDANITTAAGGSFSLRASNIEIDGQIDVPSGSVALTASPQDYYNSEIGLPTPYTGDLGNILVSSGATISTAGLTFDELNGASTGLQPFSVNGGSIKLNGASTVLDVGSTLDASGGAARNSAGTIYSGNGGSISLTGLYDGPEGEADGSLMIDGTISAYGVGHGGTLNLTAPAVFVGDGSSPTIAGVTSSFGTLALPTSFFSSGGFSNFNITGNVALEFLSGRIAPDVIREQVNASSSSFGINYVDSSSLPTYPAYPVSLSFSSTGLLNYHSQLIMGADASISTGALGSVSLSSQLDDIAGSISAPGGSISISGDSTIALYGSLPSFTPPPVTVYLEPTANLSVAGTTITTPTNVGSNSFSTGEVLNGGSISVTGNIVAAAGSKLNADGTAGTIAVPISDTAAGLANSSLQSKSNPYISETLVSNGGSIVLNGDEELYDLGSVSARAGKSGNLAGTGGTLTVSSGIADQFNVPANAGSPELFIQQDGTYTIGDVSLGAALTAAPQGGGGYFTVDQFIAGGFGSLILKGNVDFEGTVSDPVTITASQEVEIEPDAQNGTIFGDGSGQNVTINAPYIYIGSPTLDLSQQTVAADAPAYVQVTTNGANLTASPTEGLADPTYGADSLTLNASDLIDTGFLSLQNFGTTNLSVATGDIRGGGLFYAAGNINLTAGQIYTPTACSFTIAAFGTDGTVNGGAITISAGDSRPLPLSAGGTLNIYATTIKQDGVLEAPFGVINLGALANPNTGLTPVLPGVTYDQESGNYVANADTSQSAPVTTSLTLGAGSITSVSGVSGSEVLDLPYGTILNGTNWIAPNGEDITAGGLPAKAVNLQASSIDDQTGAVINLNGGGDLFAYEFNPGIGGTNDILSIYKYSGGAISKTSSGFVASSSFAIVPTYGLDYSAVDLTRDSSGDYPYASLGNTPSAGATTAASLADQVGNVINLAGGDNIAAGNYAILPARYALLPGAYLVTPTGSKATQTSVNPDGSINMAGYVYNDLNGAQNTVPLYTDFTIESNAVVNKAAPYSTSSANTLLAARARAAGNAVPLLPVDAGQLAITASTDLTLNGSLEGQGGTENGLTGLNGQVDIATANAIYIVSNSSDTPTFAGGVTPSAGTYLTLSAQELDGFDADSLLIGGYRTSGENAASIDVLTNAIYVENDATALTGNEIILASNQILDLASGATIKQSSSTSNTRQNLTLGSASTSGSGDGVLLRVTDDPTATVSRAGVNTSDTAPALTVGAGVSIGGQAVTLDSTANSSIDASATLGGSSALTLGAGAISLQVDPNADVSAAPGLVILNGSNSATAMPTSVQRLFSTARTDLTFNSYGTINLYGSGQTLGAVGANGTAVIQNLTLQTAGIVGVAATSSAVTINAQNVNLSERGNAVSPSNVPDGVAGSSLAINANTINLGANTFTVAGYSSVDLSAANGILANGTGAFNAQGNLNLATSLVTAGTSANYSFNAVGGALALTPLTGAAKVTGGLGATISFNGSSVTLDSGIQAASGIINATASSGDVEVEGSAGLSAAGETVPFGTSKAYTPGGQINLTSINGNVTVDAASKASLDVSAAGAGHAGTVTISAANGNVAIADGTLNGTTGAGGTAGTFNATIGGNGQNLSLSGLTTPVTDGGFANMSFDVTNSPLVTVDGAVGATLGKTGISSFTLTAENGGIEVNNTINASGLNGGTISLFADGGITLTNNAVLSVTGQQLNDAGQGGLIDIETRGANGGVLDIGGATLQLGVGKGSSLAAGGTVHLRAPLLTSAPGGIAMDSLAAANFQNAASVVVEGYRVYSPSNGVIDTTLQNEIATDVANYPIATISQQLGVQDGGIFQLQPGIEITNPNGDLTLGSAVSLGQFSNYWDLSQVRTADNLPGILTIRASGNLVFNGSLTDGFADNSADKENVANEPYTWDVLGESTGVAENSWSYRLVAGAAFNGTVSTANYQDVSSQSDGSLMLGLNMAVPTGNNYGTTTATYAKTYAQLIRTGNGDITIDAAGSVDLLNQMATIYTAGQLAPTLANFASPTGDSDTAYETAVYGSGQKISIQPAPQYTAQYTENGGNITIDAGQNIQHLTLSGGELVPDTSWQLPTNWLYRRGATTAAGLYDMNSVNSNEVASTTWWINFSNFFEGIGALGGGNVTLNAGQNIINVDAVVPTNARMPVLTNAQGVQVTPSASNLVELGGGDLAVIAGGTIEGGDYYVEHGAGLIQANTISSDGDTARITPEDAAQGSTQALPITLFVGDASFSVNTLNNVEIGSAVNPFLLPQGIGNDFYDESIFSTYGPSSSVSVSSLLGSIFVQGSEVDGQSLAGSLANAYFSNSSPGSLNGRRFTQESTLTGTPWTLTLDPNGAGANEIESVSNYSPFYNFSPPIFDATAYSGSINYKSDQVLAPSREGTMQLLAADSIEGAFDTKTTNGLTATISILDDDPSQLPGVTNPVGLGATTLSSQNNPAIGNGLNNVFGLIGQTGEYSTYTLQQLEEQHTNGLLHTDPTVAPVQFITTSGNIEDLTLISPEKTDISSGLDLADVSLFIQNNEANDISIVSANRNITLFDPLSSGLVGLGVPNSPYATSGDVQISGPGALEVLAGGNLNLGEGNSSTASFFPDTNLGIVSIGKARDPYLPFTGASVITAAGLGDTSGLGSNSKEVDYQAFENAILNYNLAPTAESSVYLPDLATLLGVSGASDSQIWNIFSGTADSSLSSSELSVQASLTPESRDELATTIFYDVLRDVGRNHNNPSSPDYGSYQAGYTAISTLFPDSGSYGGNITLTSREVKTTSGGDIDMLAPGGGIEVGLNNMGTQAIDQGILTVDGGNISIFTNNNVDIGTSRIFTLHGGNIIIWSSQGNIDAGASSRTVQSAPPTQVLVDSQSANVETDLAGLATGGGIGVLETVVGAPPGNVDLIAPVGVVNAGDAGIRASGNINVAAAQVLNAGNIQAGGSKTGVPTSSTPNVAAAVAGANAAGSATSAADSTQPGGQQNNTSATQDLPSIISVEVVGFGGGEDDSASNNTPSDLPADATLLADHPAIRP